MATGSKRAATSSPEDLQGSSPLSPPPPETPTPHGRNAPSSPPSPLAGKRGKCRALNAGATGGIIDASFNKSGAPTSTSEPSFKGGPATVHRPRVTKRAKSSGSSVSFAEDTEEISARDSDDVFNEPNVRANVPASDEEEDTSDPGENSSDYDPENEPKTRVKLKTKKQKAAESKKLAKAAKVVATPKKRVDAKKSTVATKARNRVLAADPNGGRCLLTLTRIPAEMMQCAHVIARRTVSEELTILEWNWGMKFWTLYIDTPRNMVPVKADFHLTLDADHWMLVPHHTMITHIRQWIDESEMKIRAECTPISESYTTKHFQYFVVPLTLDMKEVAIHRQKNNVDSSDGDFGPDSLESHFYPFSTLGVLTSHINPHFVIYSAGMKLAIQQENLKGRAFNVWMDHLASIANFGHTGNSDAIKAANRISLEELIEIYVDWSSPEGLPSEDSSWYFRPEKKEQDVTEPHVLSSHT
ncbi:hypothetical protein C8R43DRAFT_561581 [Mycena crocata]|nr:hypothetical protein C8R43DRAFT_561581 [Mycena crocata]